ncbi:putative polynucleotide kinase/phosphatase [Escherichia phage vB_EcoS_NBD2]|uniref:Putative polynucleotide kinase/phosphatase n=1 Tax=Escherichia phage vB_EcoS_NBD2 TaxID=1852563 RepID=A0A192YAH0_9CAUD|nr:putative polynucleotide kinase/phosphatase [Escherichia phage vB_EcoS_NBD2]ANM45856.1 putative polynucleotide kinase/phosphatase [Escherichia phage vB_EcoS_NBD2]
MNALYSHIKRHIEQRPNKPVFIFDFDGTLSDGSHRLDRLPTENLHLTESWQEFNELSAFDAPFEDTIQVMKACYQFGTVIILTGRSDSVLNLSVQWLLDNDADYYDFLVMREATDNRKDTIIKEEFLRFIGLHRITAAWDDSPKVIEHFRGLGITTYQVCDYGDNVHAGLKSHGVSELKAECDHIWERHSTGDDYYDCCVSCGKSKGIK